MALLIFILLVIVCIILGFVILIQNPKGGGLTGSIGGMTNQMMGVKQTNDVMEKGTWIFAGLIGLICILSAYLLTNHQTGNNNSIIDKVNTTVPATQPQAPGNNTVPFSAPTQQQQTNPAPAQQQAPAN